MRRVHDMPFGARLRSAAEGGGVDFRLWAPGAGRVDVVFEEGADPGRPGIRPAQAADAGWWHLHAPDASAGSLYRFRIDGDLRVPDPASRSNPDGPHGPSEVVDPGHFDWQDTAWSGRPWHTVVLYEMHIGTVTGEGTFAAAQARLPELAALGFTAIQVMPVADFPGRFGWGYDGVLQFAPHGSYGSPDDLKAFVQAAHGLGLMVFLDVVYNHFGPDGNYLHAYAQDFFSSTHENPWGRSINFDGEGSRAVRDFYIANALYWLEEFHFDGLRLDAVHAITDDSRPGILQEIAQEARSRLPGRSIHLVMEDDHNVAGRVAATPEPGRYDGQWAGDFHHLLHVLLTGETGGYFAEFAEAPLAQLGTCLTRGFAWQGQPGAGADAADPRRPVDTDMPLPAIVNYLQNHDQIGNRAFGDRIHALARQHDPTHADAQLRLATALLMLAPHTPLVFMGGEWGSTTPFLYFADWEGDLRKAVTEGRQREFAHFFADQGRTPPAPCEAATWKASVPDRAAAATVEGRTWTELMRGLLGSRREELAPRLPDIAIGGHAAALLDERLLLVRWRFAHGADLLLQFNWSALPADLDRLTPSAWATDPASPAADGLPRRTWHIEGTCQDGMLGPWSGRWQWV